MQDNFDSEERGIRDYVTSQPHAADDEVTVVQQVGTRRVAGRNHELYDVWLASGRRFWVITDMTCLYDQQDYQDLDHAFTYHLGQNLLLSDQFKTTQADEDPLRQLPKPWRKYNSAVESMVGSREPEDFQTVGIHCRETLLALGREYQGEDWLNIPNERPKIDDAVGWIGIYVNSLTANSKPRAYVKDLARRTWDMAVWLQHYGDATEFEAEIVLGATQQLLRSFNLLMARHREGSQQRCPNCDSYRVVEEGGPLIEHDGRWGTFLHDECVSCGWTSEPVFDEWERERLQRLFDYATSDGGRWKDAWDKIKEDESDADGEGPAPRPSSSEVD